MKVFSDAICIKTTKVKKQAWALEHLPAPTTLPMFSMSCPCHAASSTAVDSTLLIMSQITFKVFHAAAERIQRQLQDTELNAEAVFPILLSKTLY